MALEVDLLARPLPQHLAGGVVIWQGLPRCPFLFLKVSNNDGQFLVPELGSPSHPQWIAVVTHYMAFWRPLLWTLDIYLTAECLAGTAKVLPAANSCTPH